MSKILIVYHSGYGHTRKVAEAVLAGAQEAGADTKLIAVGDLDDALWAELDTADAIIFGAPTYMGGPSADFKKFADASSKPWFAQKWKDKIAAGFTNSAHMNGDKFLTISYFVTLAMQHGMIWVGLGELAEGTGADKVNRLSAYGGAMAQTDWGQDQVNDGDRKTAAILGKRVAEAAARWAKEK